MASILLSMAVTVEQHESGEFYWVILESFDHSMVFDSLMESAHGFASYNAALDAGVEALKGISDDPEQGPREEVHDEDDFDIAP